ncbi:MAG: sigma-70 family RNA polymerase sigma factor [Planctomycetes bacterium]|nr:sigma-70 family RNA polymerase sigma factor [Planctomycetota bacterium]
MTDFNLALDLDALADQREFARRVARAVVRDEHIAEDIAQDALISTFASRPLLLRSMRAWIGQVARNRARRWRRREEQRRQRESAVARPESAEERSARDLELQRELLEALGALEAHYRTALYLRYFEEHPPSRIAAELGVPVATVKTRLQRGLVQLRVELQRRHGGVPRAWLPAFTLFAFPQGGTGVLTATASLAVSSLTVPKLLLSAALLVALLGAAWLASPTEDARTPARSIAATTSDLLEVEAPGGGDPSIARRVTSRAEEREVHELSAPTPLAARSTPTLRGRCVAAETGQPLARCRIRLRGKAMNAQIAAMHALAPWPAPEELLTREDGTFALRFDPPAGWELNLSVQCEGRVLRRAHFDIDRAPSSRDLGDIALLLGQNLSGTVVDARGVAVAGAWVHVGDLPIALGERASLVSSGKSVGLSDASGHFELESPVPAGTWTLHAGGPDIVPSAAVPVSVPETLDAAPLLVRVERRSLPWIEGVVVDELGIGVPRVLVGATAPDGSADGRNSGTREDGTFRIRALKPSSAPVQLSILDSGECEQPLEALPTCAWGSREVRIVLRRGLAFDLRVVERSSGEPVLDYAVSCWNPWSKRPNPTALRHVGPHDGGEVTITGIERGRNVLYVHPLSRDHLRSAAFEFEAGSATVTPLVVEVERLAPLRVRVVDGGGIAVPGASVESVALGRAELGPREAVFDRFVHTWMPGESRHELLARSTTDAEGRVSVGAPERRERIVLRVQHPAFAPRVVDLGSSSMGGELQISLARGGAIAGRILLGSHAASRLRSEVFRVEEERMIGRRPSTRLVELRADGSFLVTGLAPGTYTAELSTISGPLLPLPGGSSSSVAPLPAHVPKVVVMEGQTSELEIDLAYRALATLHARVLLEGEPWTRAELQLRGRGAASGPHVLDAAGACTISGILPGTYTAQLRVVRASSPRAVTYECMEPLDLAPGAELHHTLHFVHRRATLVMLERDGTTPAILRDLQVISVNGREELRTDEAGRIVLDGAPSTEITICEGFGGRLGPRLATCVLPREPRDPELRVTLGSGDR